MRQKRLSSLGDLLGNIKNLSLDEQNALRRIGDMADATLNSRRLIDLTQQKRNLANKAGRKLPAPKNVRGRGMSNGSLIEWDPIDSDYLAFYEVAYGAAELDPVLTVENPLIQTASAKILLPNLTGNLQVSVRAVDRSGTASSWTRMVNADLPGTAFNAWVAAEPSATSPIKLNLNTPPDRSLIFIVTLNLNGHITVSNPFTYTVTLYRGEDFATATNVASKTLIYSEPYVANFFASQQPYFEQSRQVQFYTPTYDGRTNWWAGLDYMYDVRTLEFGAMLA